MAEIFSKLGQALLMAFGMFWQTGWTLVFGFTISSLLQSIVSTDAMKSALGRGGAKEIALASIAGAASSSCSYASAAIMRTLFKKGAALVNALAFLFASTNLVLELGVILLLLLGWQFAAGEWIGGIVLIIVMSAVVKLTYPEQLVKGARRHEEKSGGHQHMTMVVEGDTWKDRLANPVTRVRVAQNFAMEWSMLWKDLAIGFLVGGLLSAFVPDAFWKALFLADASPWIQIPANAVLGAVIAMLTFVCSIGNVPLAAVLWGDARVSAACSPSCTPTSSYCRCSTPTAAISAGGWRPSQSLPTTAGWARITLATAEPRNSRTASIGACVFFAPLRKALTHYPKSRLSEISITGVPAPQGGKPDHWPATFAPRVTSVCVTSSSKRARPRACPRLTSHSALSGRSRTSLTSSEMSAALM